MNEKLLGAFGEAAAAEYLRKKHYEILGMNYRCPLGELDIIARREGTVVFTEVKLRREGGYAGAAEAVTPAKQRKLRIAAESWLAENELEDVPCRFDVIEVYLERTGGRVKRIHQIEEAF
ncbi:MAG: YraN family protein [Oscillospiraceae bacterium]|nr:YraN family protein [Oscillospiraceae bacterium]MBR4691320.1 YraN family protein [Oscillospiraceae bacterium]